MNSGNGNETKSDTFQQDIFKSDPKLFISIKKVLKHFNDFQN